MQKKQTPSKKMQELIPHLKEFCRLLNSNPAIYASEELEFFRLSMNKAQNLEETIESSDEEGLPPVESFDYSMYINRVKECIDTASFDEAIVLLDTILQKHPNSATAIRLRSNVHWLTNNPGDAYRDMCLAQQLDYDEDSNALHLEMKDAANQGAANQGAASRKPDVIKKQNDSYENRGQPPQQQRQCADLNNAIKSINPESIQSMLQNPELMNMAQNMMNDPQTMKNMMNMFNSCQK